MATWDDVHRLALARPQTVEGSSREGLLGWSVRDKTFAWERPLRRAGLHALGDAAPQGPILAARVPNLGAKEALLADDGDARDDLRGAVSAAGRQATEAGRRLWESVGVDKA